MKTAAEALIEQLSNDNPGCEAVALYQNGETVLEHHFVPQVPRCIYSHTKSFTATAVGLALDEGKIKLEERLIDRFPEYESVITDEAMKTVTLRDVLTMSSGIGKPLLMGGSRLQGEGFPDYVAWFFSQKLSSRPGEKFTYSNADTHMAGSFVQRAVGETLQRYLYRKLFVKLGIGFPGWEADPAGTPFGASGMYLTVGQMMKLGILYLNDGVWNGERILSSEWVREATHKQINTGLSDPWDRGYGYQFWVPEGDRGLFRADGAHGQITLIIPDKNAVLSAQCSESNDFERFIKIFKDSVYR